MQESGHQQWFVLLPRSMVHSAGSYAQQLMATLLQNQMGAKASLPMQCASDSRRGVGREGLCLQR